MGKGKGKTKGSSNPFHSVGSWRKKFRDAVFDAAEEGYTDRLKKEKARFPGVPKGPKRPDPPAPASLRPMPSFPMRTLPSAGQAAAAVGSALGAGGVVFAASPARTELFRKLGKSVKKGSAPARAPGRSPGIAPPSGGSYGGIYGDGPDYYDGGRSISSGNGSAQPTVAVFEAPVAIGRQSHGHNPRMWAKAKNGDVSVTVEHVEYVRDIAPASGAGSQWVPGGNVWQLPVNPGSAPMFAWLSDLAGLFDEYEFQSLEFIYQPAVGTDTDGKYLMTFDPDVLDEMPDSKQDMLQARVQVDGMPWHENKLKVPRDLLVGRRYCRGAIVPADADAHFYDVGSLNIAAPGAPAGMIGEFFVKYKITFYTPTGGQPKSGTAMWNVGTTPAAPLGVGSVAPTQAVGTLYPPTNSTTNIMLPAVGTFFVLIRITGTGFTSSTSLTPAVAANQTCTIVDSAFTATQAVVNILVSCYDNTTGLTVNTPGGAATISKTVIRMCEGDLDQNI